MTNMLTEKRKKKKTNKNKCTYLFGYLSTKQSCLSHLPQTCAKT